MVCLTAVTTNRNACFHPWGNACKQGATAANANGVGTSGGGLPHRTVVRDGIAGRGAEERALRAKNEMLQRQLLHLKEVAAETQLELQAARKVCACAFASFFFICQETREKSLLILALGMFSYCFRTPALLYVFQPFATRPKYQ